LHGPWCQKNSFYEPSGDATTKNVALKSKIINVVQTNTIKGGQRPYYLKGVYHVEVCELGFLGLIQSENPNKPIIATWNNKVYPDKSYALFKRRSTEFIDLTTLTKPFVLNGDDEYKIESIVVNENDTGFIVTIQDLNTCIRKEKQIYISETKNKCPIIVETKNEESNKFIEEKIILPGEVKEEKVKNISTDSVKKEDNCSGSVSCNIM